MDVVVLNLVINGLPSIHHQGIFEQFPKAVLNLVINGLPSILKYNKYSFLYEYCFKPCYKWITFNTLNSVFKEKGQNSFKPCYKWITFNTEFLHRELEIDFKF